jgi:hypothetical protein
MNQDPWSRTIYAVRHKHRPLKLTLPPSFDMLGVTEEKSMKYLLAAFIYCATACSATAQNNQMTMFGLEIGKPLDLPVCQYTNATTSVGIQQYTCVEPASEPSQNRQRIHFGLKEIPPIVKGLPMTVQLVDGKLEALYFATPGIDSKARLLRIFTEKYGTPTTLTQATLKDADGAGYETFTAVWDTPALYVEYTPTNGSVKEGVARIETQSARRARVNAKSGRSWLPA